MQFKTTINLNDHPDSAAKAQELLEEIREKELRVVEDEFERRQNRTQSFHDYIQRQLDHPAQVLPELIQNADDVDSCDTVEIELTDDTLRIRNNGRPMKTEEVDTLCAAGESTKRDPKYIGHFGLGFKSVFSISDNPRVRTGNFHFEFDAERLTVPKILGGSDPVKGTEIILPLKDDLSSKKREELQDRLDDVHRLLTYLRNISQIEVTQEGETTVYRRESDDDSPERIICSDGEIFERRLVFETDDPPSGDAFDHLSEVRQIDDMETIRDSSISVTISFEVDDQHRPVSDAEECYLFNFLPTDERSGFPFDVHADFLLEPSRKALAWRDGAYNQWLLRRVGDTYREVVEYYRNLNAERVGHLQLLPSQKHGLNHTAAAKEAVLEALNDEDSIPSQDGGYRRPEVIAVPSHHVESVFTKSDVQHLLGRTVEYPAESIDKSLFDSLRKRGIIKEISIETLLKQSDDSARNNFSDASTAHLLVFAAALWEFWDDEYRNLSRFSDKTDDRDEFESIVKTTTLVPLESGERFAVSNVEDDSLLPPKRGREEYDIFEDEFQLVELDAEAIPEEYPAESSEIISGARKFYDQVLEIETISTDIVLKEIIAEAFDDVEDTDDDTLDTYLEYIFANKNRWSTARKHIDLKFRVQGDSDDATYRNPSKADVFLPDVYHGGTRGSSEAEYSLEKVPDGMGGSSEVEYSLEKVLDGMGGSSEVEYSLEKVLDGMDATFISEEYVSLTGEEQPNRWREFLTKFEVLERLPVKEVAAKNRVYHTHREELVDELSEFSQAATKEDWSIPDSQKKGGSKYQWFRNGRRYALSDHVPSAWFSDVLDQFSNNEGSEFDRAKALDRMLKTHWEDYEEKLYRPLYYVKKKQAYEVYRTRSDRYSTFSDLLRDTPWCLTKAETLAPPRTLLVESPATANQPPQMYISEGDSSYIEPLGVKTQLGVDVTLEQLANAPDVWGDADPPTIRKELTTRVDTLQQKLLDDGSDVKERIQSSLSDARFIYIEDADPAFRSVTDVVWNGQNLGSYIVSIESNYGSYEELFEALDVQDTIQATDYLDYLGDTAWEDDDQRDVVWRRAIRKLVAETAEIPSLQDLSSEVQKQLNSPALLSLSNKAVSLDQLEYYCHDETIRTHLRSDLADRVVKPFEAKDYTNKKVGEVWELLGLTNLGSDATLSLTDHNVIESDKTPVDSPDEFTQLFTAAYSFCLSNEHEEAGDELLRIYTDYHITVHDTVECQYRFSDGDPITKEFEVRCYLDHAEEQIRRIEKISSLQEFTQRLPSELPLPASEREELESILSGALGKQDQFLDSFLNTFEIERHSIEEAVQPLDSESGESDRSDPVESKKPSTFDEGQNVESEDEISGDTGENPLISISSKEESKTTVGDSQDGSDETDVCSTADMTPSSTSVSSQDTSEEDPDTVSEDETSSKSGSQQSERDRVSVTRSVRSNEFMKNVRAAYDRTCAVCGIWRETKDGQPEVEAHHIRPVEDDGPDSVQNGIALCRLHHWAFGKGWIAVSDDYEILVRDWEDVPGYEEFSRHEGDSLHLPDDPQQYPDTIYLSHHRQSHGFEE